MREAIQLQFGPISNQIGIQFLDLLLSARSSNDVAHHIMLHPSDSEPRLVAFDLQSSFMQPVLNKDDRKDIHTWSGRRTIHNLPESSPVIEGLELWTRTMSKAGIRLRDQNQVQLPNTTGDLFQNGVDMIGRVIDDATDAVRRQIEKCDALETIHTLSDVDSVHGAVSSVVLEEVRDDFCTSRQNLITFPIWSSSTPGLDALVNRMLSCIRLFDCSNAIVLNREPVADLNLDVAQQALALYAGSLPYRLTSKEFSSTDLLRSVIFDPDLRFASLYCSVNEDVTERRFRQRYRVSLGRDRDADCYLNSLVSVPIYSPLAEGRPPLSRLSKRVQIPVVAEWTSTEPVLDRVTRLARLALSLTPATAAARYAIDNDALEQVRESYRCLSDTIAS